MKKEFSIIIPWCGGDIQREKNLNILLDCIEQQTHVNFEIVIVEQSSMIEGASPVSSVIGPRKLRDILLTHNSGCFNKSWCMNVGVRSSTFDDLIFIDADMMFPTDFLDIINEHIKITPPPYNKVMICWDVLIALAGRDNPEERHILSTNLKTLGGVWYCNKDFYWNKLGGMNENFCGYGGEDNDAHDRAEFILQKEIVRLNYTLKHQYHDWAEQSNVAMRFADLTRNHTNTIIQLLKNSELGKMSGPTLINLENLN